MSEYVYIVDDNNKVLAKKDRDSLTDYDQWRIVSIWVTDNKGNVLLQQRSLDKKVFPGVWTAAAEGTVEYGDDYDRTAVRELEEEIGVTNIKLKRAGTYVGKWGTFGHRYTQGYFAVIDKNSKLKAQEEEVEQLKWFTPKEFEKFLEEQGDKFILLEPYKVMGFVKR